MKLRKVAVISLCGLSLALVGCANKLKITSEPSQAAVKIDGKPVGQTPVDYAFNFKRQTNYTVEVSKPGYLDFRRHLGKKDGDVKWGAGGMTRGHWNIKLQKDEAWHSTVQSDIANKWVRVQVNNRYDDKKAWQTVVNAVTSQFEDLQNMDSQSGYIKTSKVKRKYKGPNGDYFIVSRFISNVEQRSPLRIRMKLQMEKVGKDGSSQPYNRVFPTEKEVLETIQSTLQ